MSRRLLVAVVLSVASVSPWGASSARAQERPLLNLSTALSNAVVPPVIIAPEQLPMARPDVSRTRSRSTGLLAGLYVSTAVMQALDVHSTLTAFGAGASEANPLMAQVTKNPYAFIAVKAGVATSTIMAARSMSRHNKVAAIATLVAINSAYALIVQHNYKVANSLR